MIKSTALAKNKSTPRELTFGFPLSFPLLLQSPFLQLDTPQGMFNVQLRNILFCEGGSSFTTFYTRVSKPIIVLKPPKHFDLLLREYGFQRIHNKRLLNLTHITCYNQVSAGYELELTGGERITVSHRVKKSLTEALARIASKEERTSKQEDWQMINEDFLVRKTSNGNNYKLPSTSPR